MVGSGNSKGGGTAGFDDIRSLALECGLDDVGVAPAYPVPVDADLASRLVADAPRDLGYLAARLQKRLDPRQLLPGVRTVVSAVVSYGSDIAGVESLTPGAGFISRFAWSRDYHKVVGKMMKGLARGIENRFGARAKWYVDTGPVFEKAYAVAAGHGFVGKNSLIITPRFGSWVFLGTILTDVEIEIPEARRPSPGGCGRCRACQDACPANALDREYVLNPNRCLAHLTVSDRDPPSPDLADKLAGNLYGCDICQDVCPFNSRAEKPSRPEFAPLPGLYMPLIDDVLAMDYEAFMATFGRTPVKRRGRELLQATARLLQGRV